MAHFLTEINVFVKMKMLNLTMVNVFVKATTSLRNRAYASFVKKKMGEFSMRKRLEFKISNHISNIYL